MSSPVPPSESGVKKHVPFVPENMSMKEFTLRAILLGLLMTIVLGAANAYLGIAGRDHDCGHVSGSGHRHGGVAGAERLVDPGREHRPHGGIDWGVSGGGRNFHDSRVPAGRGVAVVSAQPTRIGSQPR